MRRMRISKQLSGLMFLAAAALAGGCGPSIDPAAKADIDGRMAALGAPGRSFPAPTGFVPMPLEVGQWTQYKSIYDGQPSFITQKIVGKEGDALWLETVHETYSGRSVSKILMAIPNRMDPGSIEIRGVIMKDQKGRVNRVDGPALAMVQSLYKSAVAMLIINWQGQPQEDAAAPAGSFSGCYKMRTDVQWGPWRTAATSWSHPAVPLSGTVRSVGIDRPSTMELVAFDLKGAASEL
jgi:hypothetical protein